VGRSLICIAHHEAGHATLHTILEGRTIDICWISETSGETKCVPRSPAPPIPGPHDRRALNALAVTLAGSVAHARVYNDIITNDDASIAAHGGAGDLEGLAFQLNLICRGDAGAQARLRARAFAHAERMVDALWPEVEAVARLLLIARIIGDADVREAIARTDEGGMLLGVAHRHVEPPRHAPAPGTRATPLRALTYSTGSILEVEGGALLAIRHDGRSFTTRSLGEAFAWL
jgi:hypothetical protein